MIVQVIFPRIVAVLKVQDTAMGRSKALQTKKNGNRYLARAFTEAANFAIRYNPRIKKYYQRKLAKTNQVIAIKRVAHKLARACYHELKDNVPFDEHKAFA